MMLRIGLALVLVTGIAAGAGAVAWRSALAPPSPFATAEQSFEVAGGATLGRVARDLEAAGLVKNALAFETLARWRGLGAEIRAGEYVLVASLPAENVLDRLVAGAVRTYRVAIPEGLRASEIAARLGDAGLVDPDAFLAYATSEAAAQALGVEGTSLEGYLFPETYQLARGLTPENVAAALVEEFQSAWDEVAERADGQGLSMLETVTLASIVEKETGAPEERPLIAAVFRNRMERGMRLETDPTVIYGIQDFDGNLRRVHLEDATNPYNTYQIPALPPGPIASPGLEALEAVVAPADTEYLFFVSKNDGTHQFSVTYSEHVAAVDRYQRRRRRQETP